MLNFEVQKAFEAMGIDIIENEDKSITVKENKNIIDLNNEYIMSDSLLKMYAELGFIKICNPFLQIKSTANPIAYLKILQGFGFYSHEGVNFQDIIDSVSREEMSIYEDLDMSYKPSMNENEFEFNNEEPTSVKSYVESYLKQFITSGSSDLLYQLECKNACEVSKNCPYIKDSRLQDYLYGKPCVLLLSKCIKYFSEYKTMYEDYYTNVNKIKDLKEVKSIIFELARKVAKILAETDLAELNRTTGGTELSKEYTKMGTTLKIMPDSAVGIIKQNYDLINMLEKQAGIDRSKYNDYLLKRQFEEDKAIIKNATNDVIDTNSFNIKPTQISFEQHHVKPLITINKTEDGTNGKTNDN